MLKEMLENVREKAPIIHSITNYITANDCANILLACGASPIMSDGIEEVAEITSLCGGLNINIGTLNAALLEAMIAAGKKSNELNHPVLLDPVGVGASRFRTESTLRLLEEVRFSVIRGNASEIKILSSGSGSIRGVDADINDSINDENLGEFVEFAKNCAKKTNAIIAMTGAIDIVADSNKAYCIKNGNAMMAKITGSGCQLSAMSVAYLAANPNDLLLATAAAVGAMGVCGEIAHKRLSPLDGNSSYRNYLIDAIYNLNGDVLDSEVRIEMR